LLLIITKSGGFDSRNYIRLTDYLGGLGEFSYKGKETLKPDLHDRFLCARSSTKK